MEMTLEMTPEISDPTKIGEREVHPLIDPISVILYHFYNAGLIHIAKEEQEELAPAFIGDVTFLFGGKNSMSTHTKIHNMMIRPNGIYKWSRNVRVLVYISFSFVHSDYVISAGVGFRVASSVVASP